MSTERGALDGQALNQKVASALFRAGLLDEPALRRALAEAGERDLAALLVHMGRLRPEDVTRALGASVADVPAAAFAPTLSPAQTSSSGLRQALSAKAGAELPVRTQLGPYVLRK